jgi:hypothetical protein
MLMELPRHDATPILDPGADPWSISLFDDRYGIGAQGRLLALLRQPCVTFASIARDFGVTRECVRQWHRRLLPDAPTGHERQRQCRLLQRRRTLLQDRLFAGFYRRIRTQVPGMKLTLIPSREGFRKRSVRLAGHLVALHADADAAAARVPGVPSGTADFVYVDLGASDFLFVPAAVLATAASGGQPLGDAQASPYRNTFAALTAAR